MEALSVQHNYTHHTYGTRHRNPNEGSVQLQSLVIIVIQLKGCFRPTCRRDKSALERGTMTVNRLGAILRRWQGSVDTAMNNYRGEILVRTNGKASSSVHSIQLAKPSSNTVYNYTHIQRGKLRLLTKSQNSKGNI